MLNERTVRRAIARLSIMKFFPGDKDFRAGLGEALSNICATDEQADRLSVHFPTVFTEWPGVHELRATACTMFLPADGIQADSVIYPEGIPTPREIQHRDVMAIPPAARRLDLSLEGQVEAYKQLHSAPAEYIADPELEQLVKDMAQAAEAPKAPRPRTASEIERDLYGPKGAPVNKQEFRKNLES